MTLNFFQKSVNECLEILIIIIVVETTTTTVLGANHDVAHKAPTLTLRYDSGKRLSRRHIRYYLYIL